MIINDQSPPNGAVHRVFRYPNTLFDWPEHGRHDRHPLVPPSTAAPPSSVGTPVTSSYEVICASVPAFFSPQQA